MEVLEHKKKIQSKGDARMEPKTKIKIDWHLGIPDGERYHEEIVPYTDQLDKIKAFVLEILKNTELVHQYHYEGFEVKEQYGHIEVHHSDQEYFTKVAEVTLTHCLKIGEKYFRLTEEKSF